MPRFIEGQDLHQVTLLPESLDEFIAEDNAVRVVDAFVDELDLKALGLAVYLRDVHDQYALTAGLDDGHAAGQAMECLGELDADIATTQDDEAGWEVVELQKLHVRQQPRFEEARDLGHGSVGADVDDHLVSGQLARAAVVEGHLDGLRPCGTPGSLP